MGYPIEIANAPAAPQRRRPDPAWRRALARIAALIARPFRRRRRRRDDAPDQFGRGVAAAAPPITHADRGRLDCDEIARRL